MTTEDYIIINKALNYSEAQLELLVESGEVEVAQEKLNDNRNAQKALNSEFNK